MHTEKAHKLKDKLVSTNLNSVTANLVAFSIVNRDRSKQVKRQNEKNTQKKGQFKASGKNREE